MFKMTEDRYNALCEDYMGLCLACKEEKDSCEPDAEYYECDNCGENKVFGTEQLMILGKIEIVDEEEISEDSD